MYALNQITIFCKLVKYQDVRFAKFFQTEKTNHVCNITCNSCIVFVEITDREKQITTKTHLESNVFQ